MLAITVIVVILMLVGTAAIRPFIKVVGSVVAHLVRSVTPVISVLVLVLVVLTPTPARTLWRGQL